ncbi:ACT domain-containing protein [Thalassotalea sp. HSM 43]|uniref:ACT domain-containing protein n=1 Tax=Thalassotalea sp. HSM 43 TaxID=2552945 RepID=UPI001080C5E3|nr:ACT domain-containing protein [Thalassotalea sp. HSM 43]QBY03021.1 ACT domain-containing protein [Thalassotalea sp. HSM 43]
MAKQTLEVLANTFTIHSFTPETKIPEQVLTADVFFIGKTHDELSIVLPTSFELESLEAESDWRALEVLGPLGFSLTGILSDISGVLAKQEISIFAISTFDTDYILVKNHTLANAISALRRAEYLVINNDTE